MYFSKSDYLKLEKDGFLLYDLGLGEEIISKIQKSFNNILDKIFQLNYKSIRVYDDYTNIPNISGIENIFNREILDENIIKFINKSQIPAISKDLLGNQIKLNFTRYHVTSKYTHCGKWHRDEEVDFGTSLQFQYYIFDEQGIQLIPGSHKRNNTNIENLKLKKSVCSVLNGSVHLKVKAGQLLIFKPAILHRGISLESRANMHFSISKTNELRNTNLVKPIKSLSPEWNDLLITSNPNKYISYTHKYTIKIKLLRKIRLFTHHFLFFLPLNSYIFKIIGAYPNLKLRKFLNLKY